MIARLFRLLRARRDRPRALSSAIQPPRIEPMSRADRRLAALERIAREERANKGTAR